MVAPDASPIMPDGRDHAALIFDWDGTIVDSAHLNRQALAQSLADVGLDLDPAWYAPRLAVATPELLAVWETDHGPLPESIDAIMYRVRRYCIDAAHLLVVHTDVADLVHRAYARRKPLALASNGADSVVTSGLRATGLDRYFDTVVTWSDVERGKPAPDMLLLAAARLGVEPSRCLVYEDADEGMAAAVAASMDAVDVRAYRRAVTVH